MNRTVRPDHIRSNCHRHLPLDHGVDLEDVKHFKKFLLAAERHGCRTALITRTANETHSDKYVKLEADRATAEEQTAYRDYSLRQSQFRRAELVEHDSVLERGITPRVIPSTASTVACDELSLL